MAMPRPSGKAQKIAEKTIPGLNRIDRDSFRSRKKNIPRKDDVELNSININNNIGENIWKRRKK